MHLLNGKHDDNVKFGERGDQNRPVAVDKPKTHNHSDTSDSRKSPINFIYYYVIIPIHTTVLVTSVCTVLPTRPLGYYPSSWNWKRYTCTNGKISVPLATNSAIVRTAESITVSNVPEVLLSAIVDGDVAEPNPQIPDPFKSSLLKNTYVHESGMDKI